MEIVSDISSIQKDASPAIPFFSPESPASLLGFSRRSFNALTKGGYDTVGKVLSLDKESLVAIENLGKKSIKEILTIQNRLRQQAINPKEDYFEMINIPDCRFIYSKDSIRPTDYIGILDISIEAHNVLYNASIFTAGKLLDLDKEAVNNLKNNGRGFFLKKTKIGAFSI